MAKSPALDRSAFPDTPGNLRVVHADDDVAPARLTNPDELRIEIAHVLCLDIVGYSRLLIDAQSEVLQRLNDIVRATPQFRRAAADGSLLRLPTGDGMVLVFRESPEAPVRCALEISAALKAHSAIPLRIGIHSGPVNEIADVNERTNIAGAGINIAQRVMNCGDAGHILLSKHVAEDLEHYPRWQPLLHDLGESEVKHGAVISIVNLFSDEAGNPARPSSLTNSRLTKAAPASPRDARRLRLILPLLALGLGLITAAWLHFYPSAPAPNDNTSLGAMAAPSAVAPEKSIAVLPFENLSADKETAFFADGIQDEILTDLAKIADLKVISRTSVMQYKTIRARNLREIGRQLGVAHVLEGSVEQFGHRLRVNAQLIDARTDEHLWAQIYDRDVADVFAIQSEIAKAIAEQLQARLSPREEAALRQSSTTDLLAEKLFHDAWAQVELASNPDAKAALLQAVSLLEEAVARDPHYMRAYQLLVTAHLDLYWQGFDHTAARLERARQIVEKAAAVAPNDGWVHLMKADYAYKAFRDYDTARAELQLARRTLSNDAGIYIYTGSIDRRQGRWQDVVRNYEKGISLDPRNYRFLIETGFTYQILRKFPEAAKYYARAHAVNPKDYFARTQLAQIDFLAKGDLPQWRAENDRILAEDPTAATQIDNSLFNCALAQRDRDALRRALEAIRPEGLRDPYNNSLWSREWFVGLAARSLGDALTAQTALTAARAIEQKAVHDQPDYAAAWIRLGLIDAGLGRKDDAQREGQRATELLPVSKDAVDGACYVTNLAIIYAWTGNKDRAFEQLARSAALPGGVTFGELKLMPQWDALRDDARFKQIVQSLAPPPKSSGQPNE